MKLSETETPFIAFKTRGRWLAAVAARDARMDGSFVYAVRSTGVYCRPSCPSRRPAEKQIVFLAQPEAAERAGFRPCRRCQPRAPLSNRAEMIRRVRLAIEEQDGLVGLGALAKRTGFSAAHVQRTFRAAMGVTPRQYAEAIRVSRLKSNLRKGANVTDAIIEANYSSSSRLYERSNERLGMTPATYGRGGLGMKLAYTMAKCALGRVLVAYTERGVSAVYLGDRDGQLVSELRKEYPRAEIAAAAGRQSKWVAEIVAFIGGSQPTLDLPTDVIATAFQRRVWEALRAIPAGSTRSYTEVARAIGKPRAVRAVARACATNPTCVVVPCHRVVRADGDLSGYRWGVERKKALLGRERQTKEDMQSSRS
jgi:AraC family transcriptional regulator of adaptative response/methylated-DNA-[protein]-cysteine methyltransferase